MRRTFVHQKLFLVEVVADSLYPRVKPAPSFMIMKATEAIETTRAVMASGSYNSGYPVDSISVFAQKPFLTCE